LRPALIIAMTAMELSWLYAWSNYLCLGFLGQNAPFLPMIISLMTGAALTCLLRGRGLRIIYPAAIQAAGFAFACYQMLRYLHAPQSPFFQVDWLVSLLTSPHDALTWLRILFEAIMATFCWLSGVMLAGRNFDYESAARRFDIGLTLIFTLFIIKFLIRVRFETLIYDPGAGISMFAFLISGILCLAVSRTEGMRSSDAGLKGVVFSLAAAVTALTICSGALGFILSPMVSAAEGGYRLLTVASRPVASLTVRFLCFFFGPRKNYRDSEAPAGSTGDPGMEQISAGHEAGFMDTVAEISAWLALFILCAGALFITGILLYRLWLYLLSRSPETERPDDFRHLFLKALSGLISAVKAFLKNMFRLFSAPSDCVAIYLKLTGWGRICGVPGPAAETPREYGRRLSAIFPEVTREIMEIIHSLEAEVYAGDDTGQDRFLRALKDLRRLKSPSLWPAMVKTRLSRSFFRPPSFLRK